MQESQEEPLLSRPTTLTALVLVCAGLAFVVGASSAAAERSATSFTIRSSLDGKTVLPHRIRWIAYPSAPVLFPGVEFLIDGKLAFDDRLEPYAFASDGRDEATKTVKTGYLVTSWLSPGKHRFTVRGSRVGDRATATKTAVVRVVQAPAPPAGLAGTWTRNLPNAVPPDRGVLYKNAAPAGPYRITIDRRYIRLQPQRTPVHVKFDYAAGATTVTIRGPVWAGYPNEGGWCDPWGPEVKYTWSVTGDTLTLAPVRVRMRASNAARSSAANGRG